MDLEDLKFIFAEQIKVRHNRLSLDMIDFVEHPADDLNGLLDLLSDYEYVGNKPHPIFLKKVKNEQ